MVDFAQDQEVYSHPLTKIKIIGVGGAGGNTVNSLIRAGIQNIECIVANTDAQALGMALAPCKIQLGNKTARGLGAGAKPEVGQKAAEEDIDKIISVTADADIVFLTAGMGGGTGSGAMPVIAQALKERGILTIAIVTKPFIFEGKRRSIIAQTAVEQLKKVVDTLIVIPNQKLLEVAKNDVSMLDAFGMINGLLNDCVKGLLDVIWNPGDVINVDFADIKTIVQARGIAVMGTAKASGPDRAKDATTQAITSPLLENMSIEGAQGVLLYIKGGKDLGLHEISCAASLIYEKAHEDAHIIIGSSVDESMGDNICVTVIATGFEEKRAEQSLKIESAMRSGVRGSTIDREASPSKEGKSNESLPDFPADELNLPAFLRRSSHR